MDTKQRARQAAERYAETGEGFADFVDALQKLSTESGYTKSTGRVLGEHMEDTPGERSFWASVIKLDRSLL
jgi:hypothetical protein